MDKKIKSAKKMMDQKMNSLLKEDVKRDKKCPCDMEMKKKKKPDIVQEAKFTKEKTPYRTIKTSLKSIIKDPEIHNKINELVIKCNHIVIDAYMFIRLLLQL